MIKVFNHYLHAWTLKRIAFDFGFALLLLAGVVLVQAGENGRLESALDDVEVRP